MGADGPITDPLDIADPAAMSVIPGGASREIMKTDAFVPAYVI